MRLIDADKLIEDLVKNRNFYPALIASAIKNTPTVDAVEVVRCKDCKHRYVPCRCALWYGSIDGKDYFGERGENFYCGYGERKGNDKDN